MLCIVLSYVYDYARATAKYKSLCYYMLCLTFILLSGLRYRIGIDSIRYEDLYSGMPDLSSLDFGYISFEYAPGYVLLVALLKTISPHYLVFQIVHAAIVNIIIFRFFKSNSRNIFFAILCYFLFYYYFFNCEVLRESLAVSAFLLGWKYLVSAKWVKYYICAAIAFSFHYSAAITFLLPIFFLSPLRNFFDMSWKTIALIIVVYLSTAYIGSHFFDFLSKMNGIALIADYSTRYSNNDYYGSGMQLSLIGSIAFLLKNILYPLSAVYVLRNSRNKFDSNVLQTLQIIVFVFIAISTFSLAIRIIVRFLSYFYPIITLIISSCAFEKIRIPHHKVLKMSFGVWFVLLMPYFLLNVMQYRENINMGNSYREYYKFYPYTSVIFQDKIPEREEIINYYVF